MKLQGLQVPQGSQGPCRCWWSSNWSWTCHSPIDWSTIQRSSSPPHSSPLNAIPTFLPPPKISILAKNLGEIFGIVPLQRRRLTLCQCNLLSELIVAFIPISRPDLLILTIGYILLLKPPNLRHFLGILYCHLLGSCFLQAPLHYSNAALLLWASFTDVRFASPASGFSGEPKEEQWILDRPKVAGANCANRNVIVKHLLTLKRCRSPLWCHKGLFSS